MHMFSVPFTEQACDPMAALLWKTSPRTKLPNLAARRGRIQEMGIREAVHSVVPMSLYHTEMHAGTPAEPVL